ncbi:unnamed protein product [Prorocentrum cordatum]|uniref:Uncharacterized protein n=1 Tax=Prorocentrum cordatum TaxID=2364126 RepID=A0ABN9TWL8_9DINO|nr:unnamed protein product [Polarella glacialis]
MFVLAYVLLNVIIRIGTLSSPHDRAGADGEKPPTPSPGAGSQGWPPAARRPPGRRSGLDGLRRGFGSKAYGAAVTSRCSACWASDGDGGRGKTHELVVLSWEVRRSRGSTIGRLAGGPTPTPPTADAWATGRR